jgi:NADP-reducing hydrogenase subunit HndB
MAKLTIEGLKRIRESNKEKMKLRESGGTRGRVNVHMGTCGIAAGARQVLTAFLEGIETSGIQDIGITTSGCAGLCSREPMATVEMFGQAPVKYVDLNATKVKRILHDHITKGTLVEEYALAVGSERVG